jgi:hypothetical protein
MKVAWSCKELRKEFVKGRHKLSTEREEREWRSPCSCPFSPRHIQAKYSNVEDMQLLRVMQVDCVDLNLFWYGLRFYLCCKCPNDIAKTSVANLWTSSGSFVANWKETRRLLLGPFICVYIYVHIQHILYCIFQFFNILRRVLPSRISCYPVKIKECFGENTRFNPQVWRITQSRN